MTTLLSLLVILGTLTTANATQATLTAYQSSLTNDSDVQKAHSMESEGLPVLWTKTLILNEGKETTASSDYAQIHVSIKIEDIKRIASSDKVSLVCRIDESTAQQTAPESTVSTNSIQTRVVATVGGAPVILGRTSVRKQTSTEEKTDGRVYVLTLKQDA